MSASDLKQLETRRKKIDAEIERLTEEQKAATKSLMDARGKLAAIVADIERATREPIVTEHAILRYLERVMGLDLSCVRDEILQPDTIALIKSAGTGKYPLGEHRIVVKGMTVVTIE